MNEDKTKILVDELKFIQDVIKRMADNSFKIKGWTVTLIVIALLFRSQSNIAPFVAFIPLVAFWLLDTYFLRMERIYRKLYEWTIKHRKTSDEYLFDLNPKRFENQVAGYFSTMISITLTIFYGSLFVLLIIFMCIELVGGK